MIDANTLLSVGVIAKTHGTKGEVRCIFNSPAPDTTYFIIKRDNIPVPYFVETARQTSSQAAIIKFFEIDTLLAAEGLSGQTLMIENTSPISEMQGIASLQGYRIEDCHGGDMGIIEAIDNNTANIFAQTSQGHIIPLHNTFIRSINTEEHIVETDLPLGITSI